MRCRLDAGSTYHRRRRLLTQRDLGDPPAGGVAHEAAHERSDLAAAAGRIAARSGALSQLVRIQDALADGDYETAAQLYDALVKEYTEPVLARTGEDASLWLLTEEEAQIFSDVQEQIEQTR